MLLKYTSITIALLLGDFAYAHKVIGIYDGDAITLLVYNKPLKIRLANVDAPEKRQAYGKKSQESLSDICWGTDATYEPRSIDRNKRTVALVYCNGIEANTEQVKRGFAWVYTKYNIDAALPALEQVARSAKVGLWNDDNPIAPWVFRKNQKIQLKKESDD